MNSKCQGKGCTNSFPYLTGHMGDNYCSKCFKGICDERNGKMKDYKFIKAPNIPQLVKGFPRRLNNEERYLISEAINKHLNSKCDKSISNDNKDEIFFFTRPKEVKCDHNFCSFEKGRIKQLEHTANIAMVEGVEYTAEFCPKCGKEMKTI